MTASGRQALGVWLGEPASFPRTHEAVVKLLAADLADEPTVRGSLRGLRAEAADLQARLAGNRLPLLATELVAAVAQCSIALPSAARLAQLGAAETGIVQRDDLEPIYLREPHITQSKKPSSLIPPVG